MADDTNGDKSDEKCAVKVYCRFRPLNSSEEERRDAFLPSFQSSSSVSFAGKTYTFDHVFDPEVEQSAVYESVASKLVDDVIKGKASFYTNDNKGTKTDFRLRKEL